jgi:hypothetical protein
MWGLDANGAGAGILNAVIQVPCRGRQVIGCSTSSCLDVERPLGLARPEGLSAPASRQWLSKTGLSVAMDRCSPPYPADPHSSFLPGEGIALLKS